MFGSLMVCSVAYTFILYKKLYDNPISRKSNDDYGLCIFFSVYVHTHNLYKYIGLVAKKKE